MGTQYGFHCRNCGYNVVVSGGTDVGFFCATVTISCETCKKLYDVVISKNPSAILSDPDWETRSYNASCPKSKKHTCHLWRAPGPCPKCGNTLKSDEATTVIDWD